MAWTSGCDSNGKSKPKTSSCTGQELVHRPRVSSRDRQCDVNLKGEEAAGGTEGINMLEEEFHVLLYFPTCESEESQLGLQEATPVHKVHLHTTYIPVTVLCMSLLPRLVILETQGFLISHSPYKYVPKSQSLSPLTTPSACS